MKTPLFLRPWRPGDTEAFTPSPLVAAQMAADPWPWGDDPPATTWAIVDGEGAVRGVAGLAPDGLGVLQAWSALGPIPRRWWPHLLWLGNRELTRALRDPAVRAVEAYALVSWPGALRCLQRLGFSFAGRVRQHATGQYHVLAREA